MKTNCWMVLGVMLATSAVAQVNTNSAPTAPAPVPPVVSVPLPETALAGPAATNAPAKKAVVKHKKHTVKKGAKSATKVKKSAVAKSAFASPELPVTLLPGGAEVATDHVNVRGQAGVKGEVITHLKKGDKVTVLAEITLDKHAADEPAHWAKIALPADVKVWVNAKFIDATNKVVSPNKLNVRGGPGENFSVLGVLEQGTPVNQVSVKGDWLQIDAPTNAYAFVAASLLKPAATTTEPVVAAVTPPPTVETPTPVAPAIPAVPTTTTTVADAPPVVTAPAAPVTDTNVAAVTTPATPVTPPAETNVVATVTPPTVVPPADDETNLPPRIVTHEGIVHNVRSIIAPTYYQLDDLTSGHEINYLYTTTTNLDLSHYKGLHVIVTGEESLAARWKNTPLLTIQRIQVVE